MQHSLAYSTVIANQCLEHNGLKEDGTPDKRVGTGGDNKSIEHGGMRKEKQPDGWTK